MSKLSVYISEAESKEQVICIYLSEAMETAKAVEKFANELEEYDDFQLSVFVRLVEYYSEKCKEVLVEMQRI